MSYIRHKILIDSRLSQAYTREQPEKPQRRRDANFRPVNDNENRLHLDRLHVAFLCRLNMSVTGFRAAGTTLRESN